MKHYFLGLAANYTRKERFLHFFTIGRERDRGALQRFLVQKYKGQQAILTKNGRSGLALALKAYFRPGDKVIVNGFTCYAVYEAVKAAELEPIWADINKDGLNFDIDSLKYIMEGKIPGIKGIIIQNSLGNPVDIVAIEKFAKQHNLTVIEDLAHCVGVRYPDGREVGTVGSAVAFSFGKDKAIDTISGGAVVLRDPYNNTIQAPSKVPKISDTLRARFYPLFGAVAQWLSYIHLGGVWMRALVKLHWVEKSADNKLDVTRKIAKFEAKLALRQFKVLKRNGEGPIREYYLVSDREKVLNELRKNGYYFDGFWYEKPVSPVRYYSKVNFPEKKCPIAVEVASKIINIPKYYTRESLSAARRIIDKYKKEQS